MYLFLPVWHLLQNLPGSLYIPKCIYFYLTRGSLTRWLGSSLHSKMYLFLLRCITRHHYHFHLYIPKCIYFYHVWICAAGYGYRSLHSKMYLFLPGQEVQDGAINDLFTFQNVSISTKSVDWEATFSALYIPKCIYFYEITSSQLDGAESFTFQNVSISTRF